MEKIKIMVGGTNFYLNKLNQEKLKQLEIDDEALGKQRKKIRNWMREKEEYKMSEEQKAEERVKEEEEVLAEEREKVLVMQNLSSRQYTLQLVFQATQHLPLVLAYLDLPNKTK